MAFVVLVALAGASRVAVGGRGSAESAAPAAEAASATPPAALAAPDEALPPFKAGPQLVDLGDGVEVDLPAGYALFERTEARAQVEARGDDATGVLGIIGKFDSDWEIVVALEPVGHVSDSDADALDAGALLASLRQGTIEQNRVRLAKGVSELFVDGWARPPTYDRGARTLAWGLDLHSTDGPLLNVFTNVLGRDGYVGMNLITEPAQLAAATAEAEPVLRAVRFQAGRRYQDYDPATDPSSGMGLRDLVVGGTAVAVASKLGLFAKILLVLKKVGVVIAVAIGGALRWAKRKLGGRDAPQA